MSKLPPQLYSSLAAFTGLAVSKAVITTCSHLDLIRGASLGLEYLDVIFSSVAFAVALLAAFYRASDACWFRRWGLLVLGGLAQGTVAMYITWVFVRVMRAVNSDAEPGAKPVDWNFKFDLTFKLKEDRTLAEVSTLCNMLLYLPTAVLHSVAAQGLFNKIPMEAGVDEMVKIKEEKDLSKI
jgi:hypothetical protein